MNVKGKIRSFSAALLLVAIFASFSSFSVVAFAADDDDENIAANVIINAREGFYDQVNTIIKELKKPINSWAGGKPYEFAMKFAGILKAAGSVLIVIFFGIGMFRTSYSLAEHKNFGTIAKSLLRLGVASAFVAKGPDIALQMFKVGTGFVAGIGGGTAKLSEAQKQAIHNELGDEKISMVLHHPILNVWVNLTEMAVYVMMIMITVFVVMRFFKFLIYIAVSPMPLAALAGEGTEQFAFAYLKALAGIALEALVIVLALRFFIVIEDNAVLDGLLSKVPFEGGDDDFAKAVKQYCVSTLLSGAAGVSSVMGADRIVTKAFGT